jgi:2-polyprenyl-3-methyl-5-hydroxy-6-metoxy-1,4-benzoquinol methylase
LPAQRVVEITPCLACGHRLFRKRFTKKERDFWRCTNCGFEKQHPLPTLEDLADYYEQSYQAGMYRDFAEAREIKRQTADLRLRQILKHGRPGRWLDVGCSSGVFVEAARQLGMEAEGIEISETAGQQGKARGLPIFRSTLEAWNPAYRYSTITAFDVIEHVLDPLDFLEHARRLLEPGGTLVITTPNQASLPRKLMGSRWYFYIPEEHLHFFNPATLRLAFRRAGLDMLCCESTGKALTFHYALIQFQEYNPLLYAVLRRFAAILPATFRAYPAPLHIGEMLAIASPARVPAI